MPSPRLIDPAVFYDVVKIRKAVDEATEDSVRASTGLSTTALNSSMGRLDSMFGSQGPGSKLSKERIFKIRQKAVKLLSKAYTLDEVAASVVTMQSTSSLEDVASHVMKRDGQDTGRSRAWSGQRCGLKPIADFETQMRNMSTSSTRRFRRA